ncbi:MAG: precorrin-8X methylmutase [Eubacteriales bacterium]|nr:precorrin-8X methylmutase [Eubacteriales bacterium]
MSNYENLPPQEIENTSFQIIRSELSHRLDPEQEPIILRCIHTSADFDYQDSLYFSEGVIEKALTAFQGGANLITDTQMALAGINKRAAKELGLSLHCFVADPELATKAKELGVTRSKLAVEKGLSLPEPQILVIGNAPTALLHLADLIAKGQADPALVIGVPVGFVNVLEAKAAIMEQPVPQIVNRGRKGGSNIAAAIVNALMYQLVER